jgi:PAS domain S-box-containing protein
MEAHDAAPAMGPQVIFRMDANGVCTESVGSGLKDLGLRSGELVGQNLFEVYAADDRAVRSLRRVLDGEAFTVEREFAGRIVSLYYEPERDSNGDVTGALGVSTDVTEQRRLESHAHAAQERASLLADVSGALTREELDVEATLRVALRALTEAGSDIGVAWLYAQDRAVLEPRSFWHTVTGPDSESGADDEARSLLESWDALPLDESQARKLLLPQLVDLQPPDGELSPDLTQLAERFGMQTLLRVPLRSRGLLVGVVDVARPDDAGMFTSDDVALICDIAERCALALDNARLLQAQRQAREDLVKFQALADASTNLIAIADGANRVIYLNPRARSSGLVVVPEDAWGTVADLVGEDTRDEMVDRLQADGHWSGDVTLSGSAAGLTLRVDAFDLHHSETGAALGTAWIAQDVTELRRTDAALRAANADMKQFKALVEASPDFVAIAGLDGTVKYVNPGGRLMVGMAADVDVTTTSIPDYLTPEGLVASVEVEQPAVVADGHWEGESTLRNNQGPTIPVAIASFLIRDPETDAPFALATVQRNITDRLAAETALRDLADQRQALLTRLVDAQDAERTRIAADVHDDPVQALAAVDLRLGMLKRRLQDRSPDLVESLTALQTSVTGATERLRALLFDLEPPDLQEGLGGALRRAGQELFEGTSTSWTVCDEEEPDMPEATRTVAYRVAKEALNNARTHARAAHVTVTVTGRDDGLAFSVIDDGVGIPPQSADAVPGHRGLVTMRDRAAVAGGHCTIRSLPEGGTQVTAWLPGPSSV